MTLKVSEEKDGAAPLSGLDPVHLAQELAILEHGAFSKIKVPEFINQAWMSSPGMREAKAPNLRRFILWFDRVAYGCATEVLRYRDATTRALAISAFIITARHCLNKLRAYNTCFEIMAGLGLGPVRRLRDTWDAVPRKFRREFEYISRLVSSEDNHREYRKRLKEDAEKTGSWDGPWVPYLGVNLKDQVFAEVGNPSYLPPDAEHKDAEACSLPVVNLCKFRRISHLLRSIVIAQQGTYRAASRPDVLRWISDVLACPQTEGELYLRSRELEGGGSGVKIRDVWPPPPPAPHAPAAQAEAPAGATTASSPAAVVTPARARAPRLRLQCNSAFECEVLLDAAEDECSVPPSPAWSSPLSFSAASTVCSEEAWAYRDAA
ncbi:MAG: ras guanine nucleotide exchange factor domain-containing protein [Olpidium bornovanus]|uniref:Ras guanine nucleotide exchange factor domain-containing protein n=1 Tax=Olpidium bornovanus TaxID=278681 RepID=A0A8H7ZRA1_9FUNG|nr:MAG: ras guanine nucleotide exchange factor domain-containing protein [Olpidium bornovanus]